MKFPKEKDRHALVMHDGLNWKRWCLETINDGVVIVRVQQVRQE